MSAEYNFHFDAEAGHVVLNQLACPVTLITRECCLHAFHLEFYDRFCTQGTKKSDFVQKITNISYMCYKQNRAGVGQVFTCCNAFSMHGSDYPARGCNQGDECVCYGRISRAFHLKSNGCGLEGTPWTETLRQDCARNQYGSSQGIDDEGLAIKSEKTRLTH